MFPLQVFAANSISDGTFINHIGTGLNLTPWSDLTNAGITQVPAPTPIPGNYASLPIGSNLFQRISTLPNGDYRLSFLVQNQAPWTAKLVFAIQQAFGTPASILFPLGLAKEITIPASSAFVPIIFDFTINNPPFAPNEFTFLNSLYDHAINPTGTIINIANVSITPIADIPPPTIREIFKIEPTGIEYCGDFDNTKFNANQNTDMWVAIVGDNEILVSLTSNFETNTMVGRFYLTDQTTAAFVGGVMFADGAFATIQGTARLNKLGAVTSLTGTFVQSGLLFENCFSSGKFTSKKISG